MLQAVLSPMPGVLIDHKRRDTCKTTIAHTPRFSISRLNKGREKIKPRDQGGVERFAIRQIEGQSRTQSNSRFSLRSCQQRGTSSLSDRTREALLTTPPLFLSVSPLFPPCQSERRDASLVHRWARCPALYANASLTRKPPRLRQPPPPRRPPLRSRRSVGGDSKAPGGR